MSKIIPLFSGSKGNSYIISSGNTNILLDAGKSAKQLTEALYDYEIPLESIQAILITHEHSDHINGLRVLNSKLKTVIYATELTADYICSKTNIDDRYISVIEKTSKRKYLPFDVGNIRVFPFATSHDAVESVGYKFVFSDDSILTFATDLGYLSDEVKKNMLGSNAVVIESNHDVDMLRCGSYPYNLKKRILSDVGHLSNDSCAEFLPELINSGTRQILLAHLSAENNYPRLAFEASNSALKCAGLRLNYDYSLNIAPVNYDGTKIIF